MLDGDVQNVTIFTGKDSAHLEDILLEKGSDSVRVYFISPICSECILLL